MLGGCGWGGAVMNYQSAIEKLAGRDRRKVGHNTYLEKLDGGAVGVKLHQTYVVTFKPDGVVVLSSGGWRTVTTKDRINTYSPVCIWQKKRVWYMPDGAAFFDGITIRPDGTHDGRVADIEVTDQQKKINKFVAGYAKAFEGGKVDAPSAGDCFYCVMREVDSKKPLGEVTDNREHLDTHIEESYFVPSLLARALEVFPQSIACNTYVWGKWHGKEADCFANIGRDQLKTALKRYLLRCYGLVA